MPIFVENILKNISFSTRPHRRHCPQCSWQGTTLTIVGQRKSKLKKAKLKRFSGRNQFRAAQFVTVLIIACTIKAMVWAVRNKCVSGLLTTNSCYMTLDWWLLTSSEMSDLHASHSTLKMCNEKSWSGTSRTMTYEPYICDQFPWIDVLLHSLGDTKKFRKSQIEAL